MIDSEAAEGIFMEWVGQGQQRGQLSSSYTGEQRS